MFQNILSMDCSTHQNDWFVGALVITFHKPWVTNLHILLFTYLNFFSRTRILRHRMLSKNFPSKFLSEDDRLKILLFSQRFNVPFGIGHDISLPKQNIYVPL